jgi:thiol-disulfide isomerase/thioredoxin
MYRTYIALLAVSLLACQSKTGQQQTNPQQSSSQYDGNVSLLVSNEKGMNEQAPNFTWLDENGTRVSFAEFSKGKPVLINFWATWCGPCVREIPDLIALNEEYAAKGALIIGISADRDDNVLALVSGFAKEHNINYQIVIDNGNLEGAFGGLQGYPTTFYINKDGKIVKTLIGMQSKEKFAQELNAIL